MKKVCPLVEAVWNDCHGGDNEELEAGDAVVEPAIVITSGYVTQDNERGMVIEQDQTGSSVHRGRTTILRENLLAYRVIRKSNSWGWATRLAEKLNGERDRERDRERGLHVAERSPKKRTGPSAPPDTVHRDPAVGETDE